jgi:hypothetical protein
MRITMRVCSTKRLKLMDSLLLLLPPFNFEGYSWPLFNSYNSKILSVSISSDDVVPRKDLKGLGVSMDKYHCLMIVGTSGS